MSGTLATFLVGMGVGAVWPGYFVGRLRAEWGRGRAEAKRAWDTRKGYRS